MVGDIDGDGYADLVSVSLGGDSFVDASLSIDGMKAGTPIRTISNWGKDCQAVALGDFDAVPGKDVAGIFGGDTLRLADSFKDGAYKDEADWLKLPKKLTVPHLTYLGDRGQLIAWSEKSGDAYSIMPSTKAVTKLRLPRGITWMSALGRQAPDPSAAPVASMKSDGTVLVGALGKGDRVGSMEKGVLPATTIGTVWVSRLEGSSTQALELPKGDESGGPSTWGSGDIDKDGDDDLVQFSYKSEGHAGQSVFIYRQVSVGETDSDHDGLSNEDEARLGTDPLNPDTDDDGLLDGWEVGTFRDLDMKALGCDPRHADVICLVSRFTDLKEDLLKSEFAKVTDYYKKLDSPNPDGTKGWNWHPILLGEMAADDQKKSWWENRDKLLPSKWKGIVHWMQVSASGGGQADQLGDGGGCGGGPWTLYATYIHEFGHQMGLSHEGFYGAAWCPTYPSLMNYAYSYGYEDDIKKIRYSDGRLKDFTLNETDLDETIPLPIDKVKFLSNGPYHYRLKANGDTTLIDWNWNGVFGEKHVRADVNYAYSTTAGRRDEVDKTMSTPWVFPHNNKAYLLFAKHTFKGDTKTDPTVSASKPGALYLRRMVKPYEWAPARTIESGGVTGDPVAISYRGQMVVAYPTAHGVSIRWVREAGEKLETGEPLVIPDSTGQSPSLGVNGNRLYLFLWDPATMAVTYRSLTSGRNFGNPKTLGFTSTIPVSMAVDTIKKQVILGLAQDQDKGRASRWQIRRFWEKDGQLAEVGMEWVEGEKGGSRGNHRPIVLFDGDKRNGKDGRIYYFSLGMTSAQTPWSCAYVSQTIGDKTVNGGWLTKRYYDEWTQSRSAPGACWFGGDILYAYRWVDGSQNDRDNILHVAYAGSGIEDVPMGDFDDIGYIRTFGMRHSILYMRRI